MGCVHWLVTVGDPERGYSYIQITSFITLLHLVIWDALPLYPEKIPFFQTCRVQHCVLTTWCGLDNCCRSFAPVCKIWSMENNDVVNLPVSLLRCGHANILCIFIVPILSDLRRDQPCLASTVIFIWTTSHLFADQSTAVMARVPVTSPTAWHPAGKAKNECMLGPSKAREIETATPGARFTLVSWHCHFRCPERAGQAHIAKGELCL